MAAAPSPSPPRPPGVEVSEEVARHYDVVIGPQNEVPGLSYSEDEFVEFFQKLGQFPLKRVKPSNQ